MLTSDSDRRVLQVAIDRHLLRGRARYLEATGRVDPALTDALARADRLLDSVCERHLGAVEADPDRSSRPGSPVNPKKGQ